MHRPLIHLPACTYVCTCVHVLVVADAYTHLAVLHISRCRQLRHEGKYTNPIVVLTICRLLPLRVTKVVLGVEQEERQQNIHQQEMAKRI